MTHRVHCTNQNIALDDIHSRMKREYMDDSNKKVTALMIGDYKMKFQPIFTRETTLGHFGKRCISWHGFCLQFYLKHNITREDGTEREEPIKYTTYMNEIVNDGNQ